MKNISLTPQSSQLTFEKQLYAIGNLPEHLRASNSKERLFQVLTDVTFLETKCNYFSIYDVQTDLQSVPELFDNTSLEYSILTTLERAIRDRSHVINNAPQVFFNVICDYLDTENYQEKSIPLKKIFDRSKPVHTNLLNKEKRFQLNRFNLRHETTHQDHEPITSLALTTDGRYLVSGSKDKKVIVWDLLLKKACLTIRDSIFEITSLKISPDNKMIIAGTNQGLTYIWDIEKGELLRRLTTHKYGVHDLALTKDGKRIFTSHCRLVQIWDLVNGILLEQYGDTNLLCISEYVDCDLNIVIENNILPVLDEAKTIIRDITTWKPLLEFKEGSSCTVHSSDGSKIIMAFFDAPITVINSGDWNIVQTINVKPKSISAIACLPDETRIVIGTYAGELIILDLSTGEQKASIQISSTTIQTLCVDPNSKKIFAGTADGRIVSCDFIGEQLMQFENADLYEIDAEANEIISIVTTNKDSFVLCATKSGNLPILNLEDGAYIGSLRGHLLPAISITRSEDGLLIGTGSEDGSVRIWDSRGGQLLFTATTPNKEIIRKISNDLGTSTGDPVSAVSLSPDLKLISCGTKSGWVYIFDLTLNQIILTIKPVNPTIPLGVYQKINRVLKLDINGIPEELRKKAEEEPIDENWTKEYEQAFSMSNVGEIQLLAFSPDNTILASTGSEDGSIKLWNIRDRCLMHSLKYGESKSFIKIYTVSMDIKNKKLFAITDGKADENGILWEWDINNGGLISAIYLSGEVSAAKITTDNKHAVSAFRNGVLSITDLCTKTQQPIFGEDLIIQALDISVDSNRILCGYNNGRINVFRLNSTEVLV